MNKYFSHCQGKIHFNIIMYSKKIKFLVYFYVSTVQFAIKMFSKERNTSFFQTIQPKVHF